VKLFYDNLLTRATTAIAASTENTEWPARFVAHPWRTRIWRTLGTVAAEYVDFDLGSAVDPDGGGTAALILLDHDLQATDSLLRLYGDDNAGFSTPDSYTYVHAAGPILLTTATNSNRYWRIAFTKDAAAETRQIGCLFLGPAVGLAERPIYSGLRETREDLSAAMRSAGGQVQSDARGQFRRWAADFAAIAEASKTALSALASLVGTHTPFFIQLDESGSNPGLGEMLYVKLSKLPGFDVAGWDGAYYYDTRLELEEQL
jgi:hypothetical protein